MLSAMMPAPSPQPAPHSYGSHCKTASNPQTSTTACVATQCREPASTREWHVVQAKAGEDFTADAIELLTVTAEMIGKLPHIHDREG